MLMGSELAVMNWERDPSQETSGGVLVDSSIKLSTLCALAVKKEYSMPGIITLHM